MAKKRANAPAAATAAPSTQVQISLQVSEGTSVFYANHAEVGNTAHDFSVLWAKMPAKLSPAKLAEVQESRQFVFEASVQLIFPPTVLPGLIRALTVQKDQYEKMFGAITDTGLPRAAPVPGNQNEH